MTTTDWLARAERDKLKIFSLVAAYHPKSKGYDPAAMPITAGGAEAACEAVRRLMRTESPDFDPVVALGHALEDANVAAVMTILNGAWFGVPESTSCWRVDGFAEAVALLEDPPDDEEEINGQRDTQSS